MTHKVHKFCHPWGELKHLLPLNCYIWCKMFGSYNKSSTNYYYYFYIKSDNGNWTEKKIVKTGNYYKIISILCIRCIYTCWWSSRRSWSRHRTWSWIRSRWDCNRIWPWRSWDWISAWWRSWTSSRRSWCWSRRLWTRSWWRWCHLNFLLNFRNTDSIWNYECEDWHVSLRSQIIISLQVTCRHQLLDVIVVMKNLI